MCGCLYFLQDRLSDHYDSKPSTVVLEGDGGIPNTNEENNFEANKKTDEMTGCLCCPWS